jgi:group I intron endonuclease
MLIELNELFNGYKYFCDLNVNIKNKEYLFLKENLFKIKSKDILNKTPICAYIIINSQTGHFYIGSCLKILRRISSHKYMLRTGTHRSKKLQESYNHNLNAMIDICIFFTGDREIAYVLEQDLLDMYKNNEKLCNTATDARLAGKGRIVSEEHKEKLSLCSKNRIISEETRNKLRLAGFRRKQTPEAIAKTRAANLGLKKSQETREKISNALKGKPIKPETILKIIAKLKGKPRSPETRAKISATLKAKENRGNFDILIKNNLAVSKKLCINGHVYESINHAARELNTNTTNIRNWCKSEKDKHKGYYFI